MFPGLVARAFALGERRDDSFCCHTAVGRHSSTLGQPGRADAKGVNRKLQEEDDMSNEGRRMGRLKKAVYGTGNSKSNRR